MKKLLLSAAAFAALFAAPVAMADPNGPNDNQTKQDRPAKADRPNNDKNNDQNGGAASNAMQGPAAQGGDTQARDRNMPDRNPNATSDRNNRDAAAPGNSDNRVVNRTVVDKTVVRKTVNRTEVMKVRANVQAPRRFHITVAYRQPAGFYVHRWTFGERLPVGFYARDYWIADFSLYGLMAPWAGYEWVRVGDDAVLVDVETGEVVRVEYGLFY